MQTYIFTSIAYSDVVYPVKNEKKNPDELLQYSLISAIYKPHNIARHHLRITSQTWSNALYHKRGQFKGVINFSYKIVIRQGE